MQVTIRRWHCVLMVTVQINNVNILGRQNTFFVTNSGVQNRLKPTVSRVRW